MTPLFRAKCITSWGVIEEGVEYDVYKMDLAFLPGNDGDPKYYFLVLTPEGFKTYKASRFTYETKLEKVLK